MRPPLDVYTEYMTGKWSDINAHLPMLRELAKGTVFEIGVRTGVSTSALLLGLEEKGGHLTSIDVERCEAEELFGEHPLWSFVLADSKWAHKIICVEIDLLLVDGDHSYEGCLSDLRTFGSKSKIVCVHDTAAPNFPGVARAVADYCLETHRIAEFFPESFGMAVIR